MLLSVSITNIGGELAALGAAFLWALSAVVYAQLGQKIPPLALNLSKGVIAIASRCFGSFGWNRLVVCLVVES